MCALRYGDRSVPNPKQEVKKTLVRPIIIVFSIFFLHFFNNNKNTISYFGMRRMRRMWVPKQGVRWATTTTMYYDNNSLLFMFWLGVLFSPLLSHHSTGDKQ